MNILIVCRGPVRKEAMDTFEELGAGYGILLSEKDSVTYSHTFAPELRLITDPERVHRVPDYTGATTEERRERIEQIIGIAKQYKYTHIFAGYGFMSEDAGFVSAIENAGVGFVGPASGVHRQAGAKDTAKTIARREGVSVTPGLDNISALTLLEKVGGRDGLDRVASENDLRVDSPHEDDLKYADQILANAYTKGKGLITVEELQKAAEKQAEQLFKDNPGKRLRLKYIGGGGGKGQRIISEAKQAANAAQEVLSESKATGDADNKNFLMELNIEHTRHNEIQLLGNGDWAIALGGRDCSLQMHEQKLVELSITDELFELEIKRAQDSGRKDFAEQLAADRATLRRMEEQAERFGTAVGLNSASTFECIVSGNEFYFMEMNTRIQVEHRVTEMVYSLKFVNPNDPNDYFIVESLIEAMALIAAHGLRLPRPERIVRNVAGGEVRLNAMNDALQPHAGGLIEYWSAPVEEEIRDDQGIGVSNPDTGSFIHYYLAGAYDSNIALVIAKGIGRRENLESLADILRRMELRGQELKTNREFHYGILNFCLGMHPMLKPDTGFVVPYLAAVGCLAQHLEQFDFDEAWKEVRRRIGEKYGAEGQQTLDAKLTLLARPLEALLANPHAAAGWLVYHHRRTFSIEKDRVVWHRNPLRVLSDLYNFFHLETRDRAAPVQQIWPDDQEFLLGGFDFYNELERHLGIDTEKDFEARVNTGEETLYHRLDHALLDSKNTFDGSGSFGKLDDSLFASCAATHRGWQSGFTLLDLFVAIGKRAGILDFAINDRLEPIIPEQFNDKEKQKDFIRALAPPPQASADLIVAASGGMFYARETPESEPYLEVGSHFSPGQPLYIIEVMKMFNKVNAEFAGTVKELLVDGDAGQVVKKGQPLFRVEPDEEIKIETAEDKAKRRKAATLKLFDSVTV